MLKPIYTFLIMIMLAAVIAGCARKTAPARQPVVYNDRSSYVAPQSAPVLPPSYPSLAGEVVQPRTASIEIVQGR